MKNLVQKISRSLRLVFISFFYGLRGADLTISAPSNGGDGEIKQKMKTGNVLQELLEDEQTQQVEELRDANYRILKEADKYEVSLQGVSGIDNDDENGTLTATVRRKELCETPRIPVYETSKYKTTLIQDSKDYENDIDTRAKEGLSGVATDDLNTLLFKFTYNDIIPKYRWERYVKRVVLKESKTGKLLIDLYFSEYARQFNKIDSLFIAELNKLFKGQKEYHSELLDISNIEFITDKAFGSENFHQIRIKDMLFKKCVIYDGHFVVEYACTKEDEDITLKYKTESLDTKYKNKSVKHESTDINVITRHLNDEDKYKRTVLKLEE